MRLDRHISKTVRVLSGHIRPAITLAFAFTLLPLLLFTTVSAQQSGTGGKIENDFPRSAQPLGYSPKPQICPDQKDKCVDKLIQDMEKQFNALGCSHNAAFSLLYLRTTEGIDAAIDANEFENRALWNQVTTAFGVYYLEALKDWQKDKKHKEASVPEAWRIAFEASNNKEVSTLGDIYLSINAHINRDLAFVYYQMGVENYNDHIHVNNVLTRTRPIAFPEINNRLDNTLFTQTFPPGLDLDIFAWRDVAWNNAQRLAAAPDAEARGVIAREIEQNSVAKAQEIAAAFPATNTANDTRDAYCKTNRD